MAFLYTKDKWAEKEIRETTLFTIFTNNIIVYLGDHKNSTRELLNLIKNFSKVAGYKIN